MTRKEYKCVLFDLDHTLWDYETNSSAVLVDLYNKYELAALGACDCGEFVRRFTLVNTELWDKHDRNEISREVLRYDRFDLVFKAAGVQHRELSLKFSEEYLVESPKGK